MRCGEAGCLPPQAPPVSGVQVRPPAAPHPQAAPSSVALAPSPAPAHAPPAPPQSPSRRSPRPPCPTARPRRRRRRSPGVNTKQHSEDRETQCGERRGERWQETCDNSLSLSLSLPPSSPPPPLSAGSGSHGSVWVLTTSESTPGCSTRAVVSGTADTTGLGTFSARSPATSLISI